MVFAMGLLAFGLSACSDPEEDEAPLTEAAVEALRAVNTGTNVTDIADIPRIPRRPRRGS